MENDDFISTSTPTPTGATAPKQGADSPPANKKHILPEAQKSKIDDKALPHASPFLPSPVIGTGWRWYDVPYRLLSWLAAPSRRRVLPLGLRRALSSGLNILLAADHYERAKLKPRDDPMSTLIVPSGEKISQGGIWVVEFFPPSYYVKLKRHLQSNGWDAKTRLYPFDGTNAEHVERARQDGGLSWSRLGSVTDRTAESLAPDSRRENLPEEFSVIHLSTTQIGRSLTAVTAFVQLSEVGQRSLDSVWRAPHEPTFEWRGLGRPDVQNRLFAAGRATQCERQRLHDLARRWLAARCGGFFADTRMGQPVIDLSLFASFDPAVGGQSRPMQHALRALGLGPNLLYNYTFSELPDMVLFPRDALGWGADVLENCWGVAGSDKKVSGDDAFKYYGDKPYKAPAVAARMDSEIQSLILHAGTEAYARELTKTYAVAMDKARTQYRRHSAKHLKQLRSELLTKSLDLPGAARDTHALWDEAWTRWQGVSVTALPLTASHGLAAPKRDFIESLRKSQEQRFKVLQEDDATYREVLATVASLGASVEASRLGRRALVASLVSLGIAVVAILLSSLNDGSILSQLIEWAQSIG